jgi:hypothetical protein
MIQRDRQIERHRFAIDANSSSNSTSTTTAD